MPLFAQSDLGELRITVVDQAGLPVSGAIEVISESNQVHRTIDTDPNGIASAKRLPFGFYTIDVRHSGSASARELIEIRSAIVREVRVTLSVAPIETAVTVRTNETLFDPHRSGPVNRIGVEAIDDRDCPPWPITARSREHATWLAGGS